MPKGAINLVVTDDALKQVKELNDALKESAKSIAEISKQAIGTKQTKGSTKMTAEMREQKRLLTALEREQAKYNARNSEAAAALRKVKSEQQKFNETMRKGATESERLTVRVKSFFKTLVLFDVARRAVDAFWGSFKKGFQNLKQLLALEK